LNFFSPREIVPKMRPLNPRKPTIVSILDIGSSKTCCLIARLTPRAESLVLPGRTHRIEVLGLGHQKSRGIRSGAVVDLEAAEHSIRLAVDAAERMAGLTVDSLIVSISTGRIGSEAFSADISLGGHQVVENDIARVLQAGAEHALAPERSVVHSIPIGFSLDGDHGVSDPRGMVGETLGVDMHVVTAENAPLKNLELCINRAHLSVEAMVVAPYASGISTLVDDESQMGCGCVDLGAETTSLSVFMNSRFVYCDSVPVGGGHVTMDIARGLSTRLEDAEKLKILHGSALSGGNGEDDVVNVPPIGEDDRDVPNLVPRAQLTRIIRPRVEETLELIRDHLGRSGFAGAVGKRLVLTGGASQLNGIGELARRILGRNVRIGRPTGVAGMPESAKGPAFATAVGLLIYPQMAPIENFGARRRFAASREVKAIPASSGGPIARLGNWLRDSL
jgi:cell division protein FtsA